VSTEGSTVLLLRRWRSTSGPLRKGWTFWRARYEAPRGGASTSGASVNDGAIGGATARSQCGMTSVRWLPDRILRRTFPRAQLPELRTPRTPVAGLAQRSGRPRPGAEDPAHHEGPGRDATDPDLTVSCWRATVVLRPYHCRIDHGALRMAGGRL
jgi:hypothetical protein